MLPRTKSAPGIRIAAACAASTRARCSGRKGDPERTVTRRSSQAGPTSQAEVLQSLMPEGVDVVKAFNVLSAYTLENGGAMSEPKEVRGG